MLGVIFVPIATPQKKEVTKDKTVTLCLSIRLSISHSISQIPPGHSSCLECPGAIFNLFLKLQGQCLVLVYWQIYVYPSFWVLESILSISSDDLNYNKAVFFIITFFLFFSLLRVVLSVLMRLFCQRRLLLPRSGLTSGTL